MPALALISVAPSLNFDVFKERLSRHVLGPEAKSEAVDDLLNLQRIWNHEADWYWSSPLIDPGLFERRAKGLRWSATKLAEYDRHLEELRGIAARYAETTNSAEREMRRLAATVVNAWGLRKPSTLSP